MTCIQCLNTPFDAQMYQDVAHGKFSTGFPASNLIYKTRFINLLNIVVRTCVQEVSAMRKCSFSYQMTAATAVMRPQLLMAGPTRHHAPVICFACLTAFIMLNHQHGFIEQSWYVWPHQNIIQHSVVKVRNVKGRTVGSMRAHPVHAMKCISSAGTACMAIRLHQLSLLHGQDRAFPSCSVT